ncbi:MAG: division/cell wall cluster transcriptional repressor MraZ [Pseudomonadota bacterium]|nr:division/cell wall cluster transcriptional repressor MraZ [Burkholderiaceae bacterium]MDQ3188617.1 division/cell wall cluster transcriptional repressor MraZ [Pseudomonadota bacterium]
MFQGASQLTLDGKGRLSMPSRHRDSLAASCDGRLTVTRHPDGCLLIYPRPAWDARREQIAQLPFSARALQRLLLGNATDVDLDSAGRVLVPTELRAAAQLERDLMLLGMGAHFELWDAARLSEHERAALANGLPESAAGFTF